MGAVVKAWACEVSFMRQLGSESSYLGNPV